MPLFKNLISNLPEVTPPTEKKLNFNTKLKWTLIVIVLFFILSNIPLFGLASNALKRFEYLSVILGATFGSLMSLGIGPIVTASIVLQLLVGSELIKIDTTTEEGRKYFQGIQKFLAIGFTVFESVIYVLMKGLGAVPGLELVLIIQLIIGGLLVILMDDLVSKYGFGSGISLFIVAGVAWELFVSAFAFIGPQGTIQPVGRLWVLISSIANANPTLMALALAAIISTVIIFLVVVYVQSMKVEIPLSFGRVRGFGFRWPLAFLYASNIPVILTAALLANIQLIGRLSKSAFIAVFDSNGVITGGILKWFSHVDLPQKIITRGLLPTDIIQAVCYTLFMIAFSILFAVFWVKTSGMDAKKQAENIAKSGMSIPGFRQNPRVLESILERYIMPLTVMGGAAVGLLAAGADLLGALVRGTGLLLSVMIVYKMYENIAQQHAYDMHPVLRKLSD
ncbi:preprotein translocase subunit SecY [Candidatus Pacearchaeota archaeon CG1_02_31_27]|nr:MAG: preprotein translocase subunit SecY [Candidatus Pacearchaeota archaeon CG1_02_31_27]PIN92379.1 MAG: preprotein translocase subunit SecY [Candidatus Pacearchaeota archaeon CG10_big_fil_rev_8_21_14_0_10_31_59]PIZ80682.1 MAG: preprotein translocase subunit SecY [Candidatus Pacearchaeota archaeon CG_4_10_14_0_2_um_filter_31_10]